MLLQPLVDTLFVEGRLEFEAGVFLLYVGQGVRLCHDVYQALVLPSRQTLVRVHPGVTPGNRISMS